MLQRRANHSTFRLFRIDADRDADLLERPQITEIPTLLVLADGKIRGRLSAPSGCAEIRRLLSPWLT